MATVKRSYQYSFGSWYGKLFLWLFLSTVITSMLFDFPNSIFDVIEGVSDTNDWLRLGGSLAVILLISSYAVNLYPNVEVVEDGLWVDFFWTRRHLPWSNLVDTIETGKMAYKSWAVEVKRFSLLHRLYGLLYLKSFSRPCFIVFSYLPNHDKLIEKINREIKKHK
jgi:hypothetical protein